LFDRPTGGERTVLVHLQTPGDSQDLSELQELAISAGAVPVATVTARRATPDPRYYLGSGKVEELQDIARSIGLDSCCSIKP
jgi:GTP-binding protein HflX